MSTVSSPCIGTCRIEQGRCVGCGRTKDQIAQWRNMSESERLAIMKQLAFPA